MNAKLHTLLNIFRAEMILIRRGMLRVLIPVFFIAFIQAGAVSKAVRAFIGVSSSGYETLASMVDLLIRLTISYLAVIVSVITATALTGLVGEERMYGMSEHVFSSGQSIEVIVYGKVLGYALSSILIGYIAVSIFSLFLVYSIGPGYINPEYILQAIGLCTLLIAPITTLYCVANYVIPKTLAYAIDFAIIMITIALPSMIFFREEAGATLIETLLGINVTQVALVIATLLWISAPLAVLLSRRRIVEKSVLPQ